MTSDEIVGALEDLPAAELEGVSREPMERYFLFSVGAERYALPPAAIKEIVSDLLVFPLPACPPYVAGLVNNHGRPHAVIDLKVLLSGERLQASQFLILSLKDDEVAFGCSEVDEIVELPLSAKAGFSDRDQGNRFCAATLDVGGQRVPLLSVEDILRQLESDFA